MRQKVQICNNAIWMSIYKNFLRLEDYKITKRTLLFCDVMQRCRIVTYCHFGQLTDISHNFSITSSRIKQSEKKVFLG